MNRYQSSGRRIATEWKVAAGLSGVLIYFFLQSHHGLRTYFNGDDVMNLVTLHGYWRWPWWKNALDALLVVTPTYRPMGDMFYRSLYSVFGFDPLPFRAACYALMLLNLGLFFRLGFLLSRSRESALLSTLIFSFHAALNELYLSTGTVYDILCVCFTLAALTYYARIRRSSRELRVRDIVILLLLYGGALDSKEMAVSLPLALVLYEVALAPFVPPVRLWRRAWPVLLAGALTMAFLAAKIPALSDNPNYRPRLSFAYLLNNASHYVSTLVFRDPLGTAWLSALTVLAAIVCVAARRPAALFGLGYGFVALLPIVAVPARDGFVLYLPMVGFALFAGDSIAAARQAAQRFLPFGARRPFWISISQAGLFAALTGALFVIHARHWHDPSQDAGREDNVMRETVRIMRAAHPTLPAGTRLLFLDDPLPKNQFDLLMLVQAAYHDPSLWVERQRNSGTPIDPVAYAIFDTLVSLRDGKWSEQRVPPIRWEEPGETVTFTPGTAHRGQSVQIRVGSHANAALDIEYETTWRYSQTHGVALKWVTLNADGFATIPLGRSLEPQSIKITAVRLSGDVWRKAQGGFVIR
jgi:hypothetical protein